MQLAQPPSNMPHTPTLQNQMPLFYTQHSTNTYIDCWTDGSFQGPSHGGLGYVIKTGTTLLCSGSKPADAISAFHAEALAMLYGMTKVLYLGTQACIFHTDSMELLQSLFTPHASLISCRHRRAWSVIMQIRDLISQHPQFAFTHTNRGFNYEADHLARTARVQRACYESTL
ncbi:Reverse transcriptase-like protein [Carex littledalei]|uniref:Reverse transcriptase-like protein n=1 Tax=Carex littledalei TaxID=544730 RepID=A0A833RKJ4_9POAL|nr:Reverse transcriptase-like protein [Carex littledalei]